MNLKDSIMEWLLAAFDRFMDWLTHGEWTRVSGEVKVRVTVKEAGES